MNGHDLARDTQMHTLELEFLRAQEATIESRGHLEMLAQRLRAAANLFEAARGRLEILEIVEARAQRAWSDAEQFVMIGSSAALTADALPMRSRRACGSTTTGGNSVS
ncbi:MAG: hypothetical protein ABSC32_11630 [Steroidobacteraceae bacterium]|jgi:hypothetical protein